MSKLIGKILVFTIVMGIVAFALNTVFGHDTVLLLSKEAHYLPNGAKWYMWKFNWWEYVSNLHTTVTDASVLQFKLPERQWDNNVANNLALIMDYLIVIINVIIYPLKLASYLLQNVLALLGINMDATNENNGLAWLVIFARDMLSKVVVPYI